MTEVASKPTTCQHNHDLDALTDNQYGVFVNGINSLMVANLQKITEDIANELTQDRLRLVRLTTGVADAYLSNIDESIRQQYNCDTCKQFFGGLGSLAFLTKDLKLVPLAFPTDPEVYGEFVGDQFEASYKAMLSCFEDATSVEIVTAEMMAEWGEIFGIKDKGTEVKGIFRHFAYPTEDAIAVKSLFSNIVPSTLKAGHGYGPAERTLIHDTFRMYQDLLGQPFPIPRDKLRSRDLNELDLCSKFVEEYSKAGKLVNLFVTRYMIDLGLGILHFKNSVVGNVLEGLLNKLSADDILNSYYAQVDPVNYKRKVALPKEAEFEASVKFLEENDYSRKLIQRFAVIGEVDELLTWKPAVKTVDMFDKLRASVKNEEEAKKLSCPVERISRMGFEAVLAGLIERNELQGISYTSPVGQLGVIAINEAEDAGDIYVSGSRLHPMYINGQVNLHQYLEYNPRQVDGLFRIDTEYGNAPMTILAFGNAVIKSPITTLNYVEELIPELRPHQRTIDKWSETNHLNPTGPNGSLMVGHGVALIPMSINQNATISLITDKNVQEYIIASER